MEELFYCGEYFSPEATLECGQTFRYGREEEGYFVRAGERACLLTSMEGGVRIRCEREDAAYFARYFDLSRNYSEIFSRAQSSGEAYLAEAAVYGKGIRILNQEAEEMLFSFLLSQNNNIPRIRMLLTKLCEALGERREFLGRGYFTFPKTVRLAEQSEDFYRRLGFGYRAGYVIKTARAVAEGGLCGAEGMETEALREKLLSFSGVGRKVADCILLFGFHRTDAFPVDVWTERVYRERLGGTLKCREGIAKELSERFGQDSGYFQQYLFYFEREGR